MHEPTTRYRLSRRKLLGGLGAASLFPVLAVFDRAAASAIDAERYARRCAEGVIAAANARSVGQFRAILRRHTDISQLAEFALGSYAGQLPSGRRREYHGLFESWIAQTFQTYSQRLRGSGFDVSGSTGGPNDYQVNGRILGGTGMSITLRVARVGSQYRVRDVNIGGIWLSLQMRSTVTSQLRRSRGDFGALFAYLQ
jgi:ABC-type transporter MlaC component